MIIRFPSEMTMAHTLLPRRQGLNRRDFRGETASRAMNEKRACPGGLPFGGPACLSINRFFPMKKPPQPSFAGEFSPLNSTLFSRGKERSSRRYAPSDRRYSSPNKARTWQK
jgi:hypothetical protein